MICQIKEKRPIYFHLSGWDDHILQGYDCNGLRKIVPELVLIIYLLIYSIEEKAKPQFQNLSRNR